jgi:hypothetical protein
MRVLRSDLFVLYQRFCVVPTAPNGEIWLAPLDQPMDDRPRSCCAVFDRLAMGLIEFRKTFSIESSSRAKFRLDRDPSFYQFG